MVKVPSWQRLRATVKLSGDIIAIHSLGPIKQQLALGYQRLHRTIVVFRDVRDSSNFYAVQMHVPNHTDGRSHNWQVMRGQHLAEGDGAGERGDEEGLGIERVAVVAHSNRNLAHSGG